LTIGTHRDYLSPRVTFNWDDDKNRQLKRVRGISFEEIVLCISEGRLIAVLEHPNKTKYPNQRLYVVERGGYAYVVPFVEDHAAGEIVLKTIYPSRQYTKRYLQRRRDHEAP
jgi:uncharacterized DUF497 family protein